MRPLEIPEDWTPELLKKYWWNAPPRQGLRYQALWLRQRGYSVSEVCTILEISADALSDWVHRARREGIESLLRDSPRPGRTSKLSLEQQIEVCNWLEADPHLTIPTLQERIMEQWGIQISGVQVWHLLRRYDFRRVSGTRSKKSTKIWKRVPQAAIGQSEGKTLGSYSQKRIR